MDEPILGYLNDLIDSYREPVELTDGLMFNQDETIRTIDFYTNSKFLSGNTDGLGREKPFYNIVNYRVTIAKVATDIDLKDIRYEPDDPTQHSVQTMLINKELYKYLKEINISKTFNEYGYNRPKYGGVLVKKTKMGNDLDISIVLWANATVDPVDALKAPIIETHYLTYSEIAKKKDLWENVDEFIALSKKQNKKAFRLEIKEVTGEFPEKYFKGEKTDYKLMSFYIGCAGNKKIVLHKELLDELPYKFHAWNKLPKRTIGRGVVEDGFEAQAWVNDAIISIKNAMDISGKVVLATDSKTIASAGNVISDIDNGHIFELKQGERIESLNLIPSAMPQFNNLIELWDTQYSRSVSQYDANTGETPPSGTPYSQTALLNQVANSPYEYEKEEAGIFWNEVLNDWVLPHVKKRITKEHYLIDEFDESQLIMIDGSVAEFEAKKMLKNALLNGETMSADEYAEIKRGIIDSMQSLGTNRKIQIPKGFLDVEGKITANITGEQKNKSAILQSLDQIIRTIISSYNPNTGSYAVLEDPVLSEIFGHIVELAGVPVSMARLKSLNPAGAVPAIDLPAVATPENAQPAPDTV